MQKNVTRAVIFVLFLAALPAMAAPARRTSIPSVSVVARFLVWLQSRLGPPLPAPDPRPGTATDTAARTVQPR